MNPLKIWIANPPKSSKKSKRRRVRAGSKKNPPAKQRRARARRRPAPQSGENLMASKKKRRRRRSFPVASTSKRYTSSARASRRKRRGGGGGGGGGGVRGLLGKFAPPSPVLLTLGGVGAAFAGNWLVNQAKTLFPASVSTFRYFGPVATLIVGGAGYYALKSWSAPAALGFFVASAAAAAWSFVGPMLTEWMTPGAQSLSGGGYQAPQVLAGENERVAMAARQTQGLAQFREGYQNGGVTLNRPALRAA